MYSSEYFTNIGSHHWRRLCQFPAALVIRPICRKSLSGNTTQLWSSSTACHGPPIATISIGNRRPCPNTSGNSQLLHLKHKQRRPYRSVIYYFTAFPPTLLYHPPPPAEQSLSLLLCLRQISSFSSYSFPAHSTFAAYSATLEISRQRCFN